MHGFDDLFAAKAKDNCSRVLTRLAETNSEFFDFPEEYETQANKVYKCLHNKVMYICQKQTPTKLSTSSQPAMIAQKPGQAHET